MLKMYLKIIAVVIAFDYFPGKPQVQGCKVFCEVCAPDVDVEKYYCCMEDWENEARSRTCSSTTSSTTSTTTLSPPTASPTEPTVAPTTEPTMAPTTESTSPPSIESTTPDPCPPNRCPEPGSPSQEDCQAYMRIYSSPIACTADSDCTSPFDVCCEDACFGRKICKTYSTAVAAVQLSN